MLFGQFRFLERTDRIFLFYAKGHLLKNVIVMLPELRMTM